MNKEMVGKDKPFCLTSRLLLGPRPKTCPVGNTTRLVTSTFHSSQDMMVGLGQSGDPTQSPHRNPEICGNGEGCVKQTITKIITKFIKFAYFWPQVSLFPQEQNITLGAVNWHLKIKARPVIHNISECVQKCNSNAALDTDGKALEKETDCSQLAKM